MKEEKNVLMGSFGFEAQDKVFRFNVWKEEQKYYFPYQRNEAQEWILQLMSCFREKTTFSFRYNEKTKEVIELW